MDTLDFIFLYMGIVGFILSIVSEIIIKIDDIMTDKKIDSIIIIGYLEIVVVLIAVVHFSIFHDSYEDHLEYHEELQKRKNNPNSDDNLEHNKKKKPKKRPKKKNQNSKKKNKKKKIERRKRNELYQPIWH